MSLTTVSAPSPGTAATSTWADSVSAAISELQGMPGASYFNAAGLPIPNVTWTAITLDTSYYDEDPNGDSSWDISNPSRLVFNFDGVYDIAGQILWPTNPVSTAALPAATNVRGIQIFYNAGGSYGSGTPMAPYKMELTVCGWNFHSQTRGSLNVTAGSYIELFGYQQSGISLTTVPSTVVNSTGLRVAMRSQT